MPIYAIYDRSHNSWGMLRLEEVGRDQLQGAQELLQSSVSVNTTFNSGDMEMAIVVSI